MTTAAQRRASGVPAGRVAVVGGSVIGLAIAWRLAQSGDGAPAEVVVYDPDVSGSRGTPIQSAAYVAGGMVAPYSEGWPGEDHALRFGVAALAAWEPFLAQLKPWIDPDVVRTASGSITIGIDSADADDLQRAAIWVNENTDSRRDNSPQVQRLSRAELRSTEPSVRKSVRCAYLMQSEIAIDNRRLLSALRRAAEDSGVIFRAERIDNLADIDADCVIVAAGSGSAALTGLPVRPVKGEVLRLRSRAGTEAPPDRTIRALIHGRPVYLVPRADGLVVGATQYETGEDRAVTLGGVRSLVEDAETIFPGVGDYEFVEVLAGFRPMSPDGLPLIGAIDEERRTFIASGHGRNGIAWTPITSTLVSDCVLGRDTKFTFLDPRRFTHDTDRKW